MRIRKQINEQLREAIGKCGMSINQLAAASGVPQPTIHRFFRGERDLYLESAAKLAAYFGMELTDPEFIVGKSADRVVKGKTPAKKASRNAGTAGHKGKEK